MFQTKAIVFQSGENVGDEHVPIFAISETVVSRSFGCDVTIEVARKNKAMVMRAFMRNSDVGGIP